jgi:hypothetical protein
MRSKSASYRIKVTNPDWSRKKLPANDERERSTSHRVRQDTIDFRRTTGAIKGFIADGLFIGQQRSAEFINLILDMAAEADAAQRE